MIASGAALPDVERQALAQRVLRPFNQAAAYLLAAKQIGATDALMAVAE